jgi:4-alpha-glucanotransferase
MAATSSFAELERWQQDALSALSSDYFHGRQERTWRRHARATLPPLQAASGMLICGEDLGTVPACVPAVLRDLGILSLRIQRMPPAGVAGPFDVPSEYPHCAVCSPSCHDVATTRAWWAADAARREAYAAAFLPRQLGGDYARAAAAARAGGGAPAPPQPPQDVPATAPASPPPGAATTTLVGAPLEEEVAAAAAAAGPPPPGEATPALMGAIVALHMASPAALAIFPVQDLLALDASYCAAVAPGEETINDPTVARHYWRYRMAVSLEQLAAGGTWAARLRALVRAGGRDAGGEAR